MKKSVLRRITALSAAVMVMAGSAVSCGEKKQNNNKNGKAKDTQNLMATSYRAVEMDADVDSVDSMYRVDENTIVLLGYDYENGEQKIYKTDNEFSNIEAVEFDLGVDKEKVEANVNASVSPEGDIYAMVAFTDYGDMERPDFDDPDFDYEKFDWEKYQEEVEKNAKYSNKLYVIDLDGNVKLEKEITGLDEYVEEDEDSKYAKGIGANVGRLVPCGGGRAILEIYGGMGETYVLLDKDGNVKEEVDFPDFEYVYGISLLDAKTLIVNGYEKNGMKVAFVDAETLKPTGQEIDGDNMSDVMYGTFYPGSGDYKLLSLSSSGLYGIKDDGSSDEIINWLDSDLGDGGVNSIVAMDNGEYVVLYNDYSSSKGGSTFYRLTQRDASEIENTKIITIGALNGDWEIREQVSKFNKAHDGVRFKIVDYSKFDEYDKENGTYQQLGASQLKKDIISGDAPDMICGSSNVLTKSLGKKGLFVDLYEMLDKDSDLKKEDLMPNVLKACEVDGKLLSLTSSFQISTLVAKKKNIDKERWTADELIDAYENRSNKETHLLGTDTRDSIMSILMHSFASLIDYENGKCHFDDPEFKKLLNFIDSFEPSKEFEDGDPEAEEYYSEMDEYYGSEAFNSDKVLLDALYIYEPSELVGELNGQYAKDPITFIGYPCNEGQGSVMMFNTTFSILTTSQYKDLCWELIKDNFKEETDEDEKEGYSRYSFGMSALKKNFERQLNKCMNKPYYYDNNGKKQEYEYSYYDDKKQEQVDVKPLSQEQVDFLSDYIMNTTQLMGDFDPDMESILEEEIMAYMKGEKTADEAIDLLQTRISLILSEQS
ncbi:MAG: extracellular solute-binding protein [Ruminococcus sp.]|uniref:ABC transporter substrate-binding protein n=1 Tax=Ruminococcus sp. TaxID=41978 RepID=UPI0025D3CE07|nr:extracellular solute-binding protein [Ruminococcus sp.]MBR5682559.1 extracellular solute-binding protein [Ruminococcus sp.]